MGEAGVATLVFSSSATVYGQPERLPVGEDAPRRPAAASTDAPSASSRISCAISPTPSPNWRIAILRYFNPAGAHPSGTIGEAPLGRPNNLVPLLCRIAGGEFSELSIFGNDWPTPDGTGVRDYLHVQDLAAGHSRRCDTSRGRRASPRSTSASDAAIRCWKSSPHSSVRAAGRSPAGSRRAARATSRACYADPSRATELLGWRATRGLDAICADAWRWQRNGGRY